MSKNNDAQIRAIIRIQRDAARDAEEQHIRELINNPDTKWQENC